MGQSPDYPEKYGMPDAALQRVVAALMNENDHYHNFEVWRDEGLIRVNLLGGECVRRALAELAAEMRGETSPEAPDAS